MFSFFAFVLCFLRQNARNDQRFFLTVVALAPTLVFAIDNGGGRDDDARRVAINRRSHPQTRNHPSQRRRRPTTTADDRRRRCCGCSRWERRRTPFALSASLASAATMIQKTKNIFFSCLHTNSARVFIDIAAVHQPAIFSHVRARSSAFCVRRAINDDSQFVCNWIFKSLAFQT